MLLALSREFRKGSLESLELNVITRHYTVTALSDYSAKTKYGYVSANFNNVLTIRWYFLTSVFLARCCTASECFRVLLKVIYLSRLDFKPVNFLCVCCPDDSSSRLSWVMAINSFQEPPASVCSLWTTAFTREFSECFQKSLFSSGLTYL